MLEDDYDEDPLSYAYNVKEADNVVSEETSEISVQQDSDSDYIIDECDVKIIRKSKSDDKISNIWSSTKSSDGLGTQMVSIEESLHLSMDKGSHLILGPFGARRTCYHYRPQVKRCVTSLFRTSLKKVLPSSFYCVKKQQPPSSDSSSSSFECQQLLPDNKTWSARKSSPSKRYGFSRTNHSHTLSKTCSKIDRSVPSRFGCLVHKKNVEWRASVHPCTYERILWRLPSSLWRQLALCLMHFEDDDALRLLTPVMYSLRQLSGLSESHMVYSASQDSYGVSESTWQDLVMALCMCCVLAFMFRVYEGMLSCVELVLNWILWWL